MKLLRLLWARVQGYVLGALAIVVLAGVLWLVGYAAKLYHDAQKLPQVQEQLQGALDTIRATRAEAARLQTIAEELRNENSILDAQRRAVPTRVVRLYLEPVPPAVPAAGGHDDPAAGAGPLPEEPRHEPAAGPDIGPDLYADADLADDLVAGYRALQAYVSGLPVECMAAPGTAQ